MKLIIKQYLASLHEREELDAVLPDLLSQLGMNVFSRPRRGARQDGVDVAAVGCVEGGPEAVYLFSIKPGDLKRKDWDGDAIQSLRPSLNEILDAYIRNRLPAEHRGKPIKICICVGGDIREEIRPSLEAFKEKNTSEQIEFEEWNGDRLASLVEASFLREDLLPESARSSLRKALALLDEPDASYRHFARLIRSILGTDDVKPERQLRALRQASICLWILFAWARDAGNLESAYRSAELLLLQAWKSVRQYADKTTKTADAVTVVYASILSTYQQINDAYLSKCVTPHAHKQYGLSTAVHASSSQDINLKLFDVLGRTALFGIWCYCQSEQSEDGSEERTAYCNASRHYTDALKQLVNNNPVLLLPLKDDQCIDIALAVLLLCLHGDTDITGDWLSEIVSRARFAYRTHKQYPCTLRSYSELLEHPVPDDEYRRRVTDGSILYPFISVIAASMRLTEVYDVIAKMKTQELEHCTFQYWYPDDASEEHIYTNDDGHGAVLVGVAVDRPMQEVLDQVFGECTNMLQYDALSAVTSGLWPLVLTACRHYRLPVPMHLFRQLTQPSDAADPAVNTGEVAGRELDEQCIETASAELPEPDG